MPVLDNPRHEAFAQARAKGARLEQAYEEAGFAPGNGHASRLDRIAIARCEQTL
jgi:phage terminase small subunit